MRVEQNTVIASEYLSKQLSSSCFQLKNSFKGSLKYENVFFTLKIEIESVKLLNTDF